MVLVPRAQDFAGSQPGPPGADGPGHRRRKARQATPEARQARKATPARQAPQARRVRAAAPGTWGRQAHPASAATPARPATPAPRGRKARQARKATTARQPSSSAASASCASRQLPDTGLIPAGWDGPGRPAVAVQLEGGWSLIHERDGTLWTYLPDWPGQGGSGSWGNPGTVQGPAGPQGERGEPGPAGPPGPGGAGMLRVFASLQVIRIDGRHRGPPGRDRGVQHSRHRASARPVVRSRGRRRVRAPRRHAHAVAPAERDCRGAVHTHLGVDQRHQRSRRLAVLHHLPGGVPHRRRGPADQLDRGVLGRGPDRVLHATWATGVALPGSQQELNNSQAPARSATSA